MASSSEPSGLKATYVVATVGTPRLLIVSKFVCKFEMFPGQK